MSASSEAGDIYDVFDFRTFNHVTKFLPAAAKNVHQEVVSAARAFVCDQHSVCLRILSRVLAQLEDLIAVPVIEKIVVEHPNQSLPNCPSPVSTDYAVFLAVSFLQSSNIFTQSSYKVRAAKSVLDECDLENKSWREVKVNSTGEGTYYRGEPGIDTHSFKVVGTIDADIVSVACVILETDLYNEWFPCCSESQEVGSPARFHKLSRLCINLPWPLANREAVLNGWAVDDLENNRIIVHADSLPEGTVMPNGHLCPPPQGDRVRVDMRLGGFVIESLSKKKTRLTFLMNVDPHIPHLPNWVLNWACGKILWVLLWQMEKTAKKANRSDSVYEKRRQERPEIYVYFLKRAQEFLNQCP